MPLTYFHVLTVIAESLLHQQQQAAAIAYRNGSGGYSVANVSSSYTFDKDRYLFPAITEELYRTNVMMNSSAHNLTTDATEFGGPNAADIVVFAVFELLGITGFVGNILLMTVVHRFGYLQKPSFILITSLAIADVLHTIVTSTYFYPPIVLGRSFYSQAVTRLYNAIDWSAWGITLSHMMAICVDRLLAIVLFYKYTEVVTVQRATVLTIICWLVFGCCNVLFVGFEACCPVAPLPEYYTFDFVVDDSGALNVYKALFMPIEMVTMVVLAVGNCVTLIRLYRRYRRKMSLKKASDILMDLSQGLANGIQPAAGAGLRRPQQQTTDAISLREIKVFVQIITVTLIFFAYMFNYYLFFYLIGMTDKWATMFNSLFYSVTHMINPVVYFSMNDQMRGNLKELLLPVLRKIPCFAQLLLESGGHRRMQDSTPLLDGRKISAPGGLMQYVASNVTLQSQNSQNSAL